MISWNNVFGIEKTREKKYQQINVVVSTEAIADEVAADNANESPVAQEAQVENEEQTTDQNAEVNEAPSEESSDSENNNMSENEGVSDNESDSPSSDMDSVGQNKAPVGVNPNRNINGKLILSEKIRDLLRDIEQTLDSFHKISLKHPMIIKIGDLREEVVLLMEIIPQTPNSDIMVRYELLVRKYQMIVAKTRRNRI